MTLALSHNKCYKISMKDENQYTLEELCKLVDVTRRTVRYYIQQGIVDRPKGEKRGSYYTNQHLEQLLEIRKWQRAGLNLERIKQLLTVDPESLNIPQVSTQEPGEISVRSHVFIDQGVEVQIDASKAELSPEELRDFIKNVTELYTKIKN